MDHLLPNFLIIGAMRSGTTSLYRYLGMHPDVFTATPKEVHFFDRDYARGVGWYARHFAGGAGKRAIGEATPNYMYYREWVARMAEVVPQARLIVLLRNPVDRAYSHYWMNRVRGHEAETFAEVVAAERTKITAGQDDITQPPAPGERFLRYLRAGLYLRCLKLVTTYYAREALQVLLAEDLRDRPDPTFRAVCRFLGIRDDFLPPNLGEVVNRFVEFRSLRLRDAARRWPRPLRALVGRLNERRASYPPVDPVLRGVLHEFYASENAALAAWLERDLAVWTDAGA